MEPPNKKIWPIYKTTSRPMSFEKVYLCHITTLGSDFDGPFLRNVIQRGSHPSLRGCPPSQYVPISFFSLLTDDQLINLPGIFWETNVRSPCFVRGTTIRFQRSTTPLKWKD